VGWFVYTLDLVDSALADQTVVNMVDDFKKHGACEWISGERRQLPNYLASAALPLDGIRAMLERRKQAHHRDNPSQADAGDSQYPRLCAARPRRGSLTKAGEAKRFHSLAFAEEWIRP